MAGDTPAGGDEKVREDADRGGTSAPGYGDQGPAGDGRAGKREDPAHPDEADKAQDA